MRRTQTVSSRSAIALLEASLGPDTRREAPSHPVGGLELFTADIDPDSDFTRRKLQLMRDRGMTVREISSFFGVAQSTIHRRLNKPVRNP